MNEQPRQNAPTSCDECGALIDPVDWTPITTERVEGDLVIYEFCDEECRSEWYDD